MKSAKGTLHITARRRNVLADDHLATVCGLKHGRIAEVEALLSDVPGMNRFFSTPPEGSHP